MATTLHVALIAGNGRGTLDYSDWRSWVLVLAFCVVLLVVMAIQETR